MKNDYIQEYNPLNYYLYKNGYREVPIFSLESNTYIKSRKTTRKERINNFSILEITNPAMKITFSKSLKNLFEDIFYYKRTK